MIRMILLPGAEREGAQICLGVGEQSRARNLPPQALPKGSISCQISDVTSVSCH